MRLQIHRPTSKRNETWCIDFKGDFLVKNGHRCYPLTLTDHQTRYLLKCEALSQPREAMVRPHLERAFFEFGLPERIRSDNGAPFSSKTWGGLSKLSIWWLKLGVIPELIAPGHPEQNGRHERMHRTLKADVRPQKNLLEQQLAYDRFRSIYNEIRPHEALEMKPPAKVYRPSTRIMPVKVPDFAYPDAMETRKLDRSGRMRFRGSTHVKITPVLANEVVGLFQFDDDRWLLYVGPLCIAGIEARAKELRIVPIPEEVKRRVLHPGVTSPPV